MLAAFPHFFRDVHAHRKKPLHIRLEEFFVRRIQVVHLFLPVQIGKANSVALGFLRIRRSDSAPSRADGTLAGGIALFVHLAVAGQNDVRPVRNENAPFPFYSVVLKHFQLFEKRLRIDYHSRAEEHSFFRIKDSRRHLMQRVLFFANDNRVAGIRAARETHDVLCLLRQKINNFTFAFVAPLSAHHNNIHQKASKRKEYITKRAFVQE